MQERVVTFDRPELLERVRRDRISATAHVCVDLGAKLVDDGWGHFHAVILRAGLCDGSRYFEPAGLLHVIAS